MSVTVKDYYVVLLALVAAWLFGLATGIAAVKG
ncbi:hypothetical protein SEA_VERSE_55 [Streptomyces phage Verse]|uniref:Uncharacterized protein n=2 Tax=Streptomyces phage Amela TaxID=1673877 RepID=A0A0K1YAA3_9CAUD|nr:hypothetical protein AVT29_gp54 [Streptomyces phage Amela]AKY03809.1 hypothetical protein SEA_AMELA_54 [Streptomyces phage Amela]AKY03885.1 hypothetical protein SEA_VERSE_55 [Streptomyces phage Verse]